MDGLTRVLLDERYGPVRELAVEKQRPPLDPPVEGPRDWMRRRWVLLDTLENIPQGYRRGWTEAA